jgi:hypothetical protein
VFPHARRIAVEGLIDPAAIPRQALAGIARQSAKVESGGLCAGIQANAKEEHNHERCSSGFLNGHIDILHCEIHISKSHHSLAVFDSRLFLPTTIHEDGAGQKFPFQHGVENIFKKMKRKR